MTLKKVILSLTTLYDTQKGERSMFKKVFQLILMLMVFVIVIALAGQSYAATQNYGNLIQQRKQLLQQTISRINDLIAKRERLTGQLIILQQLEAKAVIDAQAEKEAEEVRIAAEKAAIEEVVALETEAIVEPIEIEKGE